MGPIDVEEILCVKAHSRNLDWSFFPQLASLHHPKAVLGFRSHCATHMSRLGGFGSDSELLESFDFLVAP